MKVAIAIVSKSFVHGSLASITICDAANALFHLRTITGDIDELDVRLYQVKENAKPCNFTEGFIGNDGTMHVTGVCITGYKFLCALTPIKIR